MPWNADLWRGQFLQEGYRYEEAEYSQYMNHRTIRIFSCTNLSPAASFKLKARIHLTRPRQTPDLCGVSILPVFSVCCRTNEVSHGHFHPLGGETQIRSSRPLSGRFGSFRVLSGRFVLGGFGSGDEDDEGRIFIHVSVAFFADSIVLWTVSTGSSPRCKGLFKRVAGGVSPKLSEFTCEEIESDCQLFAIHGFRCVGRKTHAAKLES